MQPGNDQPLTDPRLAEMVETVVRAHIETYPEVDFIQVSVPEHRRWVSQGREAYRLLDARYDLSRFRKLRPTLCPRRAAGPPFRVEGQAG